MKAYLRTTHQAGVPKRFSAEANAAWHQGYNGFVGHMLDSTRPMTAHEVLAEIAAYDLDYQETGGLVLTEVEAALAILVHHGMAAEIEI